MVLTKAVVAERLMAYLEHRISLSELIMWADDAYASAAIVGKDVDTIKHVLARLGIADVSRYGLTWEDCETILHQLGYQVRLEVIKSNVYP